MNVLRDITHNREAHDRVARVYDARHAEIFNEVEQERLAGAVREAVGAVLDAPRDGARALDVGAGTGNLTRRLLDCGARVTAADLSGECLAVVRERFGASGRLETSPLDGEGLSAFADGSFDLAACYSVLHHIPDYLALLREMGRVVRSGGVVYLDHERHDAAWLPSEERETFFREAVIWPAKTWRRFFRPSAYWHRVRPLLQWRRWLDPRWMSEGDLHIWPDDHIEWAKVESALAAVGVRAVVSRDYLLYEPRYHRAVWDRWKGRLTDYRMWIGRKV